MEIFDCIKDFKLNHGGRSGPMRRRFDELRQVRKEAAVIEISVCCGVPDLFIYFSIKNKEPVD